MCTVMLVPETLSARISGMADIHPVGHFPACKLHLVGIEHDDIVTAVNVRGEIRLVLSTEDKSNPRSKTAERKVSSVNDNPLFVHSRRSG